jgi:zinc protease
MSPVSPGEIPRVPTGAARFRETRHAGDIVHRAYPAVDVVAWRKAGAGSVTLMLHFPGTPLIAGIEAAGWPALAARATLRGAGRLGAEDLAQRAERLGGALGTSAGPDGIGWGITVRRGAAPAAAALLRLVAAEPSFAENAVRVEARLQASDARHLRDDMFRHPMEMAVRQAFPDDPYGLPSLGDPDRIEETAASDLRRWHQAAVARRPVLVVAGDFDPEDLDGAATASGPWPVTGLPPEPGAPVWAAGRGSEPRDKRQTAIAMAFPAAPFRSPERHAAWVACAVLSGLAGRLFDEVREKRSLAYTVLAIPWLRRRAGAVLCYVATSPDRAAEARDAMLAELERLVREPPTGAELDRARLYTAGSVQMRKQSAAAVAGELLEAWVTGTLVEVHGTPAALRAVCTDDVVRFAETAFRREARAEYEITAGG